jgi:hypothetical protein
VHFLFIKLRIFLTTFPPLSANIICESSLKSQALKQQITNHSPMDKKSDSPKILAIL